MGEGAHPLGGHFQEVDTLSYIHVAQASCKLGIFNLPHRETLLTGSTLLTGVWAQLECGTLLPGEFAKKFGEVLQSMTQQSVNMTELLPSIQTAMIEPYPEVLMAIQCIRAEGLKTALVTNNWLLENGKSFCPVDVKHFDVVSSSFYGFFLTNKHFQPIYCLLPSC